MSQHSASKTILHYVCCHLLSTRLEPCIAAACPCAHAFFMGHQPRRLSVRQMFAAECVSRAVSFTSGKQTFYTHFHIPQIGWQVPPLITRHALNTIKIKNWNRLAVLCPARLGRGWTPSYRIRILDRGSQGRLGNFLGDSHKITD